MTKTAIISEFNPFHNGHKRIIDKAIEETHGDIISLQSGNFVERGEPAIQNKFIRATESIKNGVSMSLELPVYFAISNAETFATGAISVLNKYGVDNLYFGSECGDIELLTKIAENEINEPTSLKEAISFYLDKGQLFAKAKENAIKEIYGEEYSNVIKTPNNILGIEYIKAIIKTNSDIIPITSKRAIDDTKYLSSSNIRNLINSEEYENAKSFVPSEIDKNTILLQKDYEPILFSLLCNKIANIDNSEFSKIAEVTEGIENRIKKSLSISSDYQSFINNIKTKRYTMSKIKRILLSTLLHINNDLAALAIKELQNIKVLAISSNKMELLQGESINLIKGTKEIKDSVFSNIENRADILYCILSKGFVNSQPNHKMIIV